MLIFPPFHKESWQSQIEGHCLLLLLLREQVWKQIHLCGNRVLGYRDIRLSGKASCPASGDTKAHDRSVAPLFSSSNSCVIGEAEWKHISFHPRSQPVPCLANWRKPVGSHLDTFSSFPLPHFKMLLASNWRYYFSWYRSMLILYS